MTTPDFYTLTVTQHVTGWPPSRFTVDVHNPSQQRVAARAARLEAEALAVDGVLLTDRTRTITPGWKQR